MMADDLFGGTLYRWHWRKRLPERHGHLFQVVCRGRAMNSCLIQFEDDGWLVVTSRNALRRVKDAPDKSNYRA